MRLRTFTIVSLGKEFLLHSNNRNRNSISHYARTHMIDNLIISEADSTGIHKSKTTCCCMLSAVRVPGRGLGRRNERTERQRGVH